MRFQRGLAALCVALGFLSSPLPAATPTPKEIKYKSRDLERIRGEMTRKKEEKERLQREADNLSSSVEKDVEHIRSVEQSLLNTRRRQSDVQQQMAVVKNRHDELMENFTTRSAALRDAAQTYMIASALCGPTALSTVYSKQAIRARAIDAKDMADKTATERASLQGLIETQSILRGEADRQQDVLGDIRTSRRDKEKRLSKTVTRQELVDGEIKELRESAAELASLIEVLRSKAKADAEDEQRSRSQKQAAGRSPILVKSLPWPAAGKVTMRFGRQTTGELKTPFISNGLVMETSEAVEVHAVSDGKALYAGEFMGYGGTVVVEHPGDWYSVYARLSAWSVEKGQPVKVGDSVGRSRPKSGGGAESYFELRFYGKPVDPMPYLVTR